MNPTSPPLSKRGDNLSRVVVSIFFIIVSSLFLIATLKLPKASLGDPNQAMYFPMIISIFSLFISILLLVKELRASGKVNEELKLLFSKKNLILIISVLVTSFLYTFFLEFLGFLISTFLFLGIVLFLTNGPKKWVVNLAVAIIFSFITWYGFGELLNVSLP